MFRQIALFLFFGYSVTGFELKCPSLFGSIVDDDCKNLWQCVWGKPVKMPQCLDGLVYSRKYKVCVYKDTDFDDCKFGPLKTDEQCEDKPCKNGGTCYGMGDEDKFYCSCPPTHTGPTCEKAVTSFNIEDICHHDKTMIVPHPTECHQFYNCSQFYEIVPHFFHQYLQECPYPQQFSTVSMKCEHYNNVQCGIRHEHKSGCDYIANKCARAHCRPCYVDYPSCEGKHDGVYAHVSRPNSPYYMRCEGERTIEVGMCPTDVITKRQMFLVNGECHIMA